MEQVIFKYLRAEPEDHNFLMVCRLYIHTKTLKMTFCSVWLSNLK